MPDRDARTGPASRKDDPLDRLPHAGAARLPGRVLSLVTSARVAAERRLARGDACLNEEGFLPSALMVELMAQVGGLLIDEDGGEPAGLAVLAGVKRMHLHGAAREGDTITVSCELARRMGDLYLVRCRARTGGRELAHGTIQIRRLRKLAT